MTLASMVGAVNWPERPHHNAANLALGNYDFDSVDEQLAFVFEAPKAGDLKKISFLVNSHTTTGTVTVGFQDVSLADGNPDGTFDQSNTISLSGTGWQTVTLTTARTVTKGERVAVVIKQPASSPADVNLAIVGSSSVITFDHPYLVFDTGSGSWSKSTFPGVFGIEYSDGTYAPIPHLFPFSAVASTSFNSSSAPDERGLKFRFPFACRVSGFWLWGSIAADATVKLYDADGSTVLLSRTLDKDVKGASGSIRAAYEFAGTAELVADTYYRLTLVPDSTTNVLLNEFDVSTAAIMDSFSGGQDVHHTHRTDAGSWTDTTTKRAMMGVAIDQLDDGGGGGGRLINGGLVS